MKVDPDISVIDAITAGELRLMGAKIPTRVPNRAWVPKSAVSREILGAERLPDNQAQIRFRFHIAEPFRWRPDEVEA